MLTISHLDHLVLTVASIPASIAFYQRVLAFEAQEQSGRWSLLFGQQKINLHQMDHTFEPKANHPIPGSADLCFILQASLEEAITHLHAQNVPIELGPVSRQGALGPMTSLYFRDPDGNLIEISAYKTNRGFPTAAL